MGNVNVYVIDFHNTKVSESVTENADGSYSIFLNARLTYAKQIESYYHAMQHIVRNDFEKFNVDMIECQCH